MNNTKHIFNFYEKQFSFVIDIFLSNIMYQKYKKANQKI